MGFNDILEGRFKSGKEKKREVKEGKEVIE
jgi:hypothetical protein